jgi:hypothetical protein
MGSWALGAGGCHLLQYHLTRTKRSKFCGNKSSKLAKDLESLGGYLASRAHVIGLGLVRYTSTFPMAATLGAHPRPPNF